MKWMWGVASGRASPKPKQDAGPLPTASIPRRTASALSVRDDSNFITSPVLCSIAQQRHNFKISDST